MTIRNEDMLAIWRALHSGWNELDLIRSRPAGLHPAITHAMLGKLMDRRLDFLRVSKGAQQYLEKLRFVMHYTGWTADERELLEAILAMETL